jgi:hypothetical protein
MRVDARRDWYYARCLERARAAFVEIRGAAAVPTRAREIARLPAKSWRGVRVYAMTCEGPFGRGPHVQFVPEYVLWSLISLRHFFCPYHR